MLKKKTSHIIFGFKKSHEKNDEKSYKSFSWKAPKNVLDPFSLLFSNKLKALQKAFQGVFSEFSGECWISSENVFLKSSEESLKAMKARLKAHYTYKLSINALSKAFFGSPKSSLLIALSKAILKALSKALFLALFKKVFKEFKTLLNRIESNWKLSKSSLKAL